MRKNLLLFAAIITASVFAKAQTNLQVFYDFGQDRKFVTTTLEMFQPDNWGNTFFFVDYDHNYIVTDFDGNKTNYSPSGTYMEIARSLNFWHGDNVKCNFLKNLGLHLEYNGGFGAYAGGSYPINHAFLAGADYGFFWKHSTGYTSLTLEVLYKKFIKVDQTLPMQFTLVWTCADFFGCVPGLTFSGFADLWWQTTEWGLEKSNCVFLSEPQLWYNVGRWFNCPNLNVGGEVELGYNFTGNITQGWHVNPCLGVKWVFNPSK